MQTIKEGQETISVTNANGQTVERTDDYIILADDIVNGDNVLIDGNHLFDSGYNDIHIVNSLKQVGQALPDINK